MPRHFKCGVFMFKTSTDTAMLVKNKMAYRAKDPCPPPMVFSVKSWRWEREGGGGGEEEEEEGEGKKVSMLTHATARGVGKKGIGRY